MERWGTYLGALYGTKTRQSEGLAVRGGTAMPRAIPHGLKGEKKGKTAGGGPYHKAELWRCSVGVEKQWGGGFAAAPKLPGSNGGTG